jgi:hypothetical protein
LKYAIVSICKADDARVRDGELMSYSTIYKIYRTKAVPFAEFRNGWGSGPILRDSLAKVHLNSENEWITQYKRVWELFYNPAVPLHRRIALAFTFDYAGGPDNLLVRVAERQEAPGGAGPDDSPWPT